jgi:hypothetical protein
VPMEVAGVCPLLAQRGFFVRLAASSHEVRPAGLMARLPS